MNNYLTKNENAIYYECGYSCDNAIFLRLGDDAFFITDSRYIIEAKLEIKNALVKESSHLITTARELLIASKIKEITFDGNDLKYTEYMTLSNKIKIKFINQPNFSQIKRVIKSDQEIKNLKKAAQIGREGFENFATYLQHNGLKKTEKFLSFKAIENMSQKGKYELSFNPIVAINQNSAKPHAIATDKQLSNNDILLFDAGVKYKRYCSDRTCTSFVNFDTFNFKREQKFKSKKHQKIYDIVLKAQLNAISNVRVGMKAKQVDNLTRSVIEKSGYAKYFIHSTGHGVGLDIHEYPFINSKSEMIIDNNMVFTIEPGIYLENEFGIRIEDTIVMQNGRAVIL